MLDKHDKAILRECSFAQGWPSSFNLIGSSSCNYAGGRRYNIGFATKRLGTWAVPYGLTKLFTGYK